VKFDVRTHSSTDNLILESKEAKWAMGLKATKILPLTYADHCREVQPG
jgi:hypothetical protein